MNTIVGLVRPRAGSIALDGRELAGESPHEIARAGIAIVPQGRRIFARLTVEENLKLARRAIGRPAGRVERSSDVYELLPRLRERRRHHGNQLSGGEQQMVAIGRALLANPRVLLFDEPSEGLAPLVVDLHHRARSSACASAGCRRSSSSRTCTSPSPSPTGWRS